MLRSISARAIVQSRFAPVASASARRLSTVPRPSAVALGKRPALPPRSGPLVLGMMSARHISFFNGQEGAASANAAAAAPAPAAPATPLTQDAAPAASASAAPVEPSLATPEVPLSTPVPASDIPSSPVETALPPAEHLTSTAPDHHFHSDPTALLPQAGANAGTPTLQDLITNSGLPLEQVLNSPEAVHAAVTVSDLSLMGLSHSWINPAGWVRDALVNLHNITDLPWWATIMLFTLGLRACLLPMVINNMRHNLRLQAIQPQMQGLMKRVSEARAAKDEGAMAVASNNLSKLFKEHKVNPLSPLKVPFFQIPIFISMFYALRGLAEAPLPQLKEGGFSWVTDLTVPDPYFILPITSLALQLTVFKLGVDGTGPNGAQSLRTMAHMRNFMFLISPVIIFMVSKFPAAVLFYWTSANAITLAQAIILRQPAVRKFFNISQPKGVAPPPNAEPIDPNPSFRDTFTAAKDWHLKNIEKFSELKASTEAAKEAAEKEKRLARPTGTAMMYEKVSEQRPVRAESATVETTPATPASREEAKRRRVEAARAKRAGKQ